MRIALIAPPWLPVPPPAYGGTEAVVDRLARGLVNAGHDVILFTTGDSTCPVPRRWVLEHSESIRMGVAVVELRHLIHAYQEASKCDIVHDHTIVGPIYAEKFHDLPVVTTNHGPFNDELAEIYAEIAETTSIIAISHNQGREGEAKGVPIAKVIHHGIDLDEFRLGPGDRGYFLFLGRMAPDKGARRAALVAREAGVRLLIAAKMREPLESLYFEDQVRPLLGGDIEYVGEVARDEKTELLAGARALLNPIRWPEPFGLVMIEALASGTPVLAFKEGAAPEIVDHEVTGFLCDDEADMVKAIARVGEIDRAACRAVADKRFSTERVVADHLELFDRVLSRRGARR